MALNPSTSGKRPRRHHNRLSVGVIEGVLDEPFLDQLDETAVAERIADAGGDMETLGPGYSSAGAAEGLGGDGDDGGNDQIDGDDVGDPFGNAGELARRSRA